MPSTAREGFTLTDQIASMYGYNDSAAAAQKAMMLSALSAKVTLADGSELALNVPGSFGNNRGWKLTFDKLPAGGNGNR